MSTRSRRLTWVAVLALVAGCGGSRETASNAATEASKGSGSGSGPGSDPDPAVTTARAIRANPAATDSILTAHGLSRNGFDSLMYDVAADAERARAYAEAMR